MDVAVAEMPKAQIRAPGIAAITASSAFAMKAGMADTGTETSCLIDPPSGFCAFDMLSETPEIRACWVEAAIAASLINPASKASSIRLCIIVAAASALSRSRYRSAHTRGRYPPAVRERPGYA